VLTRAPSRAASSMTQPVPQPASSALAPRGGRATGQQAAHPAVVAVAGRAGSPFHAAALASNFARVTGWLSASTRAAGSDQRAARDAPRAWCPRWACAAAPHRPRRRNTRRGARPARRRRAARPAPSGGSPGSAAAVGAAPASRTATAARSSAGGSASTAGAASCVRSPPAGGRGDFVDQGGAVHRGRAGVPVAGGRAV
jgi:hypothetical protein